MSEQVYDDDLYDPYEASGGGNFAPVISWKYSRPGDTFEGIVVPAEPIDRPDKGYRMRREYQDGTDLDKNDKGLLVWPPKNNKEGVTRPVTEAKFAQTWPDEDLSKAGKVSRTNVTFLTDYKQAEFISDAAKRRAAEQVPPVDMNDERERRVIISGPELPKKIDAALAKAGRKPMPGQHWKITLIDREENVGSKGATRRHEVVITPPTPETLKIVADYVAAKKAAADAATDAADTSDPWAAGTTAADAVSARIAEPPF